MLLPLFFATLFPASFAPPTPGEQPAPRERQVAPKPYFPGTTWEHKKPSDLGLDDRLIAEAVAWAQTQETDWPKDFSTQSKMFGRPLGPVPTTRAGTNGLIIKGGYIIAEFGDTTAVDPTYSVAKSYLSTLLGLTIDRGMIPAITDRVAEAVHDGGYDDPPAPDGTPTAAHNSLITWQHHATQTSEWRGTLFGKAHDFAGAAEFGDSAMPPRQLREPGTYFEYNDVRVNRLSLSLLRLWKCPLSDVLRTEIMDPIGASHTWKYLAYDNATVDVEGTPMPSVSGGTRWGAGLWMSSLDHARFGLLMLRKGEWNGRRIISERWISEATRPQGVRKDYGYLWWLNTQRRWPDAPASSFSAQGAGDNTIWVDPEHDLVVVWRWHKGSAQPEFYKRILGAITTER